MAFNLKYIAFKKPQLSYFALTLSVLGLSGCANLEAISDISTRLTSASASWNDVAIEVSSSCQREQALNSMLADCTEEKKASKGLVAANAVLRNYFAALGAAAKESNFTIQPGLDQASTSVGNIPGINRDQVSAASGLFGLLANLATGALREETLRDLIDQGAPSAKTVIKGLDDLVVSRLNRRLIAEKAQLDGKFAIWIQAQGHTVPAPLGSLCSKKSAVIFSAPTSGPSFLLAQEYCQRLSILEARTKAITKYQTSLKKSEEALSELQSSKTKLKAKALAAKLYEIGSALDADVEDVRKAFG